MGSFTSTLIDHARSSGGVITRSEALALGVPSATLSRMVSRGILRSSGSGVYVLPGFDDELLVPLHAACRKLGAVTSHEAAAQIHQLDRPRFIRPTVSVPRRRTKVFEAVVVHQLTDLTDDHITTVHGLPITTPERTIIDLSAVLGRSHLEQIIDNSLAARRVDLEQLGTLFGQLGRRGKPGTAKLRAILEPRQSGYHAPESELERRLVGLLETHGLPNPVLQFSPEWLAPTNGRVDLAYPEAFLVIEGDSRRWHTMLNSFESDRQRDNAAQLAGWSVLRFTWDDIVHRPEHIAETVRKALNLSRSRSYMSGSS